MLMKAEEHWIVNGHGADDILKLAGQWYYCSAYNGLSWGKCWRIEKPVLRQTTFPPIDGEIFEIREVTPAEWNENIEPVAPTVYEIIGTDQMMKRFYLAEDNAGILILITFNGEDPDYIHTFRDEPDQLKDLAWCLNDLWSRPGCNPAEDWDNNEIDEGVDGAALLKMMEEDRLSRGCSFGYIADEEGFHGSRSLGEKLGLEKRAWKP